MNKEIETIVKKTAKVAGVTCIAAGAVALMTSAAALKALTEGAKYLQHTVKKIIDEKPAEESPVVVEAEEAPAAEPVAEAVPAEENTATEEAV